MIASVHQFPTAYQPGAKPVFKVNGEVFHTLASAEKFATGADKIHYVPANVVGLSERLVRELARS